MKYQFEQCIRKGKILRIEIDPDLIEKEMDEAINDLNVCEKSIIDNNFKWAIIQAYYSMFHSFRAILFSKGYREKSHICLKFAMEALLVDEGLLDNLLLRNFDFAKKMREGADYGYIYSKETAIELLDSAKEIYINSKNILQLR